jgi:hypothetical protein
MTAEDETPDADPPPSSTTAVDVAPPEREPGDPDALDLGSTGELLALADEAAGIEDKPLSVEGDDYVPASPVVTGLRPRLADSRGGTSITVLGAGFAPGCRVLLDGEELVAEVLDGFMMRFIAPEHAGDKAVVEVESVSGKRCPHGAELDFAPGPSLVRAVPHELPLEGGVHVTIEGERFADGCTLSLFGAHAPEVVFDGPTRISFLAPPATEATLEGLVVVTNPNGLSGRSETLLRYRPLDPKLEKVEPNRGWVSGGKVLSLVGVDFHERARVTFGGRPAVVRYKNRSTVEVEVPAADEPGAVDVVLTNPDGRVTALAGAFTYEPVPAPPKIIDVIPRTGLTTGGATIRITGDNFTDDVRVMVGELTAVRTVVSAKLIDAKLPARQLPGPVAIEITLEGVSVRAEDIFTYESPRAPKIAHLEPRTGPTSGGTRVVIEGEGFPANASVRFGGEPAKTVVVKNATRIETVTPARAAGMVDVEVSSAETGAGVAKAGFKYETTPPPVITLLAPNKGTIDGGTELSIEGKNFAEGVVVLVGGVPVKTKRISGSVLEAKTPEGDDGKLVDVAVKNPDGQQAVQKRAFQYDARYRS